MVMKGKKEGGWNACHGPVGPVCDFNHNPYNEVVEDAWYQQLYPLPLSRYNHQVSGNVAELFVINLASKPPMGPSSSKAVSPQEFHDATLHPITTNSLPPSVAVCIWVEYSFGPSGVRLSPLSRKWGPHNDMVFQDGYGRQLIRYLKVPIQPNGDGTVKIRTRLLIEEQANQNSDSAARIDINISEANSGLSQ